MHAANFATSQPMLLTLRHQRPSQIISNNLYIETIFYRYLPGRIIFLLGTYAAGKTTIANYVKQNSQFSANIITVGDDYIWAKMVILALQKTFPKQINFLRQHIKDYETLLFYINQPHFFVVYHKGKNFVNSKIQKTLQQIYQHKDLVLADVSWESYQYCLSNTIIFELQSGKTVLIDTLSKQDFLNAMVSNFIKCQLNTVIVYCCPSQLMEHIIEYNHHNINNLVPKIRTFFPFNDYLELYSRTSNPNEAIDLIRVSDIEKLDLWFYLARLQEAITTLLEKNQGVAQRNMWQNLLSSLEFRVDEKAQPNNSIIRRKFITKLFDGKQMATYITPKDKYQLLLDTGLSNKHFEQQKLTDLIDKTEPKQSAILK